jgi:DNA-binding Xre family transcriptional regulator
MPKSGGILYAIKAVGTSLVKIGYTTGSVEKRLKILQTGQPFKLEVLCILPVESDVRGQEVLLHAFLAQEHRRGEWFELRDEPCDLAQLLLRAIQFGQEHPTKDVSPGTVIPPFMQLFAERLCSARHRKQLSKTTLAARAGLNLGNINEIENEHKRSVRADTVVALAVALGVSSDYLLGLSEVANGA